VGKKRIAVLGTEDEEQVRTKRDVQREQKTMREKPSSAKVSASIIEEPKAQDPISETFKFKKPRKRSRNYKTAKAQVDVGKLYPLEDAIKLLRSVSYSSSNRTVELHINVTNKSITREVELPFTTGKIKRVAIVDDSILAKIEKAVIDFDVLLTTPANMPKLVKFAKVLGPRGLMPNPKTGTVVDDPVKKAKDMTSKNSVLLKTEKEASVIHTIVGKLTMSDNELFQNISTVLATFPTNKITKVVLKSTMSPAIKLAI